MALAAGDEKQLAERPTRSLPAYEAFLKGQVASAGMTRNDPASLRKALVFYDQAVELDPEFAQAWAHVAFANTLLYINSAPTKEVAERSRDAASKALALAPIPPPTAPWVSTRTWFAAISGVSQEQFLAALRIAPNSPGGPPRGGDRRDAPGQWDAALQHLQEARRLDPRSALASHNLGLAFLNLRRYPQARNEFDYALALSPGNVSIVEQHAMTLLGEGNLEGARSYLASSGAEGIEPAALIAYLATYWDLGWVLTDAQRDALLRMTPAAFDDDRPTWGICLAQAFWWKGDGTGARRYGEEARKAFEDQLREAPDDPQLLALLGLALAYEGRGDEAIRSAERAVELRPVTKNAVIGPYYLYNLARVYVVAGRPDKAVDSLERLLAVPFYVSRAWLTIDSSFDPLRKDPRFQKLVAGAK